MNIDLGLGQIEMVAVIWLFTQVLKRLILDRLSDSKQDKATILLCFLASIIVIHLNYPHLDIYQVVQGGLMYSLMALGAHGGITGLSVKAKAKL